MSEVTYTTPETFFSEDEMEALLQTRITRGKRKGKVRKTPCKFGTPGYIYKQALTLALNPYRMPSECVMLLDADQKDLLLRLSAKINYMVGHPAHYLEWSHYIGRILND